MTPTTGERVLRFVGDQIQFQLRSADAPQDFKALLRTNLGKAAATREEIISSYAGKRPMSIAFWRDLPMRKISEGEWQIDLPLTEPGYFRAKAYVVDQQGKQIWPDGADIGISVHPNCYRTANTIYCAFTRMFGDSKRLRTTRDEKLEGQLKKLDERGYTVIPPSGKLRDLTKQLPHIIKTLGCRILHLLPVNPTPTTFARFGRFGSPYACEDLTAIDPALVEFDQRTTGVEQFCELTYEMHRLGGRVILDVVINHTGWGSTLFENHPKWFLRDETGKFVSPGAWGNIWADLVELNPNFTELWEHFAETFLTWCRRGVDGFRCDAGYKVPLPVWQYIEARVRQEFPDTLFLLEGLGGPWAATETLLTEGGMQWAYSELFQNYSGRDVAWYLDYALCQSERVGVYVHYSETHDNDRLAKKGRAWSLLRNRLCGLTSVCGGFGFTCGVEWLADEKIEVHQSRGMAWGSKENIIPELAQLNELLTNHPCFFDGAKLTRLSPDAAPVYALQRISAEGKDSVLVLVNNDAELEQIFSLGEKTYKELGEPLVDLLDLPPLQPTRADGKISFTLKPGATYCLSALPTPAGLSGDNYRRAKAQAAWAISALSKVLSLEQIGEFDWRELARQVNEAPQKFLANVLPASRRQNPPASETLAAHFPQVIVWTLLDRKRIVPIPPEHWLLVHDTVPFRATLKLQNTNQFQHAESIQVRDGHAACFPPQKIEFATDAKLEIERYALANTGIKAVVRFLSASPSFPECPISNPGADALVLLTNGIGGMARLPVDFSRVNSKYDCLLGANLHSAFPVDRHIFVKRVRVWLNADGFITPLNAQNLVSIQPGPPAIWKFSAKIGDQRTVEIELTADMLDGKNTTVLRLFRVADESTKSDRKVPHSTSLIVRVDIEDRNFHTETHRNSGVEHHFSTNSHPLSDKAGFTFTPASDRQLRVYSDSGFYHHETEWSENIPHPIEASRSQVPVGDAYSPGWFELPIQKGKAVSIVLCAEAVDPTADLVQEISANRLVENKLALNRAKFPEQDFFGRQLTLAARAFLVRRGAGRTVIAGYPWFLDWGRDSLIAARGLLAAGLVSDVTELLMTFGRFVENGTMPNTIHGEDASNRDTSDAPLWFGVVCEETAELLSENLYAMLVDKRGRTIADVLREIAIGYIRGTPNKIKMDAASGLIWSPSHFTWMDTNHPAGTPREGYPIEIQVLWIRLVRQIEKLKLKPDTEPWSEIAKRAEASLQKYFWLEERGYLADLLIAKADQPASEAIIDTALRSNYLLAVAFGFITGERAQRCVDAALRFLVVPGALRSLAPQPVSPPLPVLVHGRLVNNPDEPYCGHYLGDEDTQRKPVYHNGTAWTWTFPIFCEALARAWNFSPQAIAAAKAYLGSIDQLMKENCLGQIPEIFDGDAPHQQRGCDAQAWGVTEALRVWKLLNSL
ncbi:MAG: amylo-alpha-1,6-glucosidase [Verrucomicrobiota bacterium]